MLYKSETPYILIGYRQFWSFNVLLYVFYCGCERERSKVQIRCSEKVPIKTFWHC